MMCANAADVVWDGWTDMQMLCVPAHDDDDDDDDDDDVTSGRLLWLFDFA